MKQNQFNGRNIFGKTPFDYSYLRDAKSQDIAIFDNLVSATKDDPAHKFDSLGNTLGLFDGGKKRITDSASQAQAVTWLSYNTAAMQAEIQEIMYSEYRLDEYFPIKTSIPEGAKSYEYRVVDRKGTGKFIGNAGSDAPTASITAQVVNYIMDRGGLIPQWSDEDLRNAIFAGIPLDTQTITGATRGCLEHIEKVGLGIDNDQRFEGLLTMSKVAIDTATTAWNAGTPDDAVKAILAPIETIIKSTNEIFGRKIKSAMGIYVSIELANYLTNTRLDTVTGETIWEFVERKNLWTNYTTKPLKLIMVQELSTAGAGGINRALYGFPDEKEVWEMGMSISPRVMYIDRVPYYYQAPMEYKISGLNVYRPGGMLYVDNVYV